MSSADGHAAGGAAQALKPPADAAKDYETVALILQGGGALGAYQAGVYQALHEAGIRPNWIAGISIGAINAALIAGNPPERRVEQLQAFWETISSPAIVPLPRSLMEYTTRFRPSDPTLRSLANTISAMRAIVEGQQGFFTPRIPSPWLRPAGSEGATSFYDTSPLRTTLAELIDFERLNSAAVRISLGAVDVATGNLNYFDNRTMRLRPEHIVAAGSLPPGFPAIEIDGHAYWDGGVVSNTPLSHVLRTEPRRDTLALQVDLWSARGPLPRHIGDVLTRQKDIQYSSRTRAITDVEARLQKLRCSIGQLLGKLPPELATDDTARELREFACNKVFNIIHLIYHSKPYELSSKDYEFGFASMRDHWQRGFDDMHRTLEHRHSFERPPLEMGVVTHDIHREDRGEPSARPVAIVDKADHSRPAPEARNAGPDDRIRAAQST
jgi:NTE family protein